ncbi:MAG: hypothetical protein ABJB40_13785, partial [Acidobacteriota bacterium]
PGDRGGMYINEGPSGVELLKQLDRRVLFRILFLLTHGHKGTIGHTNNYASQKEVKELATEFEIDYVLTDAEARLELCPKKHNAVHEIYLKALQEKGEGASVPQLFSEKWKAGD